MSIRIRIESLNKNYGKKKVLKAMGLDIEFEGGAIVGLVGINGAGKSTLLRIIGKIDGEYSGECEIEVGGEKLKSKFETGFLPEERSLPAFGTVNNVLTFWAELRGFSGSNIREAVDLWVSKLRLKEYSETNVKELSKGNKQKLQLACCLIHEPKVIVFDEPFSGLDPGNQEVIVDLLIESKSKGALIFISAHQLELVERICDKTFLMNEGKLVPFNSSTSPKNGFMNIKVSESSSKLDFLNQYNQNQGVIEVNISTLSVENKACLFEASLEGKLTYYLGEHINLRDLYMKETNRSTTP